MAAQRGRLMLLKIGTAAAGTLLGGLKSTTFTMNNSVIDVSTKDTLGWRELLEDGSLKFFSVACDGIFKDSTTDETIRGYVFANTLNTFTFVLPQRGHRRGHVPGDQLHAQGRSRRRGNILHDPRIIRHPDLHRSLTGVTHDRTHRTSRRLRRS